MHQPKLWMNLGSSFMRQGRKEQAMWSFISAVKEDPKSSVPLEQLGACYCEMGDLAKALDAYQKAVALDKHSSDAFRGLGKILMLQFLGDQSKTALRDQALTAWNTSLELNANQDDLKKLVEKYTPKPTTKPL